MHFEPMIFVVDDDAAVTNALAGVARLMGKPHATYASSEGFLASYDKSQPGCLILDYKLPGANGLELQQKLTQLGNLLPVIMMSGHADIRIAVDAMSDGALRFIEKPFALDKLCQLIKQAFELDAVRRVEAAERDKAAKLIDTLTKKELEVLYRVSAGKSNKEIAKELGLSVRAVEDRRARMMRKLEVEYLSEVIEIVSKVPKPAEPMRPSSFSRPSTLR